MPNPLNDGLAQLFYAAGDAALQGDLKAISVCLESVKPLLSAIKERQEAESKKQKVYEVHLTSYGDRKINVIKELRTHIKGLGLKQAKEMAESAPTVALKTEHENVAVAFRQGLIAAGGTAEIRETVVSEAA